jgi:hypothetical protein
MALPTGATWHNRCGRLRQVKVPDVMLDIVVISQWEYELRFYRPEQVGAKRGKLYELVGEPFVVYRFRNPNPPSENRLEATPSNTALRTRASIFMTLSGIFGR